MRFRNQLLFLVLSVLIPALMASALAVWYVYDKQRKAQDENIAEAARSFALLVENEFRIKEETLKTLAQSPLLARGSMAEFHTHAKAIAPSLESNIVLMDETSRQLLNTRRPFGAELPASSSSNVLELRKKLGQETTVVSDIFMAQLAKRLEYTIQVPIPQHAGQRLYLSMASNASSLQKIINNQKLPSSWVITIVDRNGTIAARSRNPEKHVGQRASGYMQRLLKDSREGIYESVTLDGIPVKAFYSRVPNADWSILISIPKAEIHQLPMRAAAFLAGMFILFMVLAAIAAQWFARRVAKSIDQLDQTAQDLGEGKDVVYFPQSVKEIDTVGMHIAEASKKILHTTSELQRRLAIESRHANLLGKVADASKTLNMALSASDLSQILVEEVRHILGVHQAVISLTVGDNWSQAINAVSLSEKYAGYQAYAAQTDGSGIYAEVCRTNRTMRFTQEELENHPAWKAFGSHAGQHPPMRGWLAVPLIGHDGRNLGLIQASDKYRGEFTAEDQAILTQLAAIAATGFENASLYASLQEQDRRKDEFLAMLAHELRNPLAPISAAAELMELVPLGREEIKQTSEIILRQVRHMTGLVDDLLDVSRVTRGLITLNKTQVDLKLIVKDAVEQVQHLVESRSHQLTISMPEESISVLGDHKRLVQILANLLNNAAKYTQEHGAIQIAFEARDDQVSIIVSDNGTGIPADLQSYIFDLFSQAERSSDRSQGGLGIGLALVKSLVALHGGAVTCHSEGKGEGSRFTVTLPRVPQSFDIKSDQQARLETYVAKNGLSFLVVDDNADAANMMAQFLKAVGHKVMVEHSSAQALERVKVQRPDVCILDIGLPEIDGNELARRLRQQADGAQAVLIAVTGYGQQQDKQNAIASGFDYHMVKPVSADKLLELVYRHLATRNN
jgi:signal transduction histidine kinase/CheY-like chemotaxis protein